MNILIKPRVLGVLIAIVLFIAGNVYAKTASQVFEAVSPSIVIVQTYDANGDSKGFGSGVVLSDGVVATNYHVIKETQKIQIVHQGKEYPATLIHFDWDRDVCTLSVNGFKAPAVVIGSTNQLKVGAQVYAIGAPQGFEMTLTEGIVSSLRKVEGGHYIQTTTAISPGSSGGGLFDEQGRLLGLTSFYIADSQSLNFAVPIEWIEELPKQHTVEVKNTENSLNWINKAQLLEKRNDLPALVDHFLRWTKAQPEESLAWSCLGSAYYQSGQTEKAIEACKESLRINPNDADAWYNLGTVYSQSSRLSAKAIEAFQQGLRINPEDAAAWYNLGLVYSGTKQNEKAIEAFLQALRINSENAAAWSCLGSAYKQSGQTEKAIEACKESLRINPNDADAWSRLGSAYYQSGQTEKAIDACKESLRINPNDAHAWYNLGTVYMKSGETTETTQTHKAIEAFQQGLRINPEDAAAWYNLGIVYGELSGQPAKAIEAFQQALRINPENAAAWNQLGNEYGRSGQYNKAIESFLQSLRINPDDITALCYLGVAYSLSGQKGQAMDMYKQLKKTNPEKAAVFFEKIILP